MALVVTPALCLILLARAPLAERDTRFLSRLKGRYGAWLPAMLDWPRQAVVVVAALFAVTLLSASFLGEEFMPKFKEYDFLMHWVEKPGTSLDAMQRITVRASRELRAIPGVRNFGAHIGRAEVADEVVGPNFTELWISLDPTVPYGPTVEKIQQVVDGYPGLYRDLLTYLKERIKEVLTGGSAAIVVRVYGAELGQLRRTAAGLGKAIGGIDGVADLQVEPQVLVPETQVRLRPGALQQFGLTPGDVRRAAAALVKGAKVGEIYDGQRIFDVAVWGTEPVRRDLAALRQLRIDLPGGGQVPLGDVADVYIAPSPNVIQRENASRRIDVACNVKGRDLGSVAREIETRVRAFPFERGYHAEVLGEYAARQAGRRQLFLLSLLSLAGVALVLHADFQSSRLTLLVLTSLPFALVGGVAGAFSRAACCHSDRLSASSRCSESPPATASCSSAITGTCTRSSACRSGANSSCAGQRTGWRRS